jgi:type IV secretory pathway VirB10-like protein
MTPPDPVSDTPRPPPPPPPESKAPPPPLMARAPRPGVVRIRKPVVQAVVAAAALLVSGSLVWAFIIEPDLRADAREKAREDRPDEGRGSVRPSERVTGQPASYDRLSTDLPPSRLESDRQPPDPALAAAAPVPQATPLPPAAGQPAAYPANPSGPSPARQAAASGLFFPGQGGPASASPRPTAPGAPQGASQADRDLAETYSPHGLVPARSPYELKAGALLPGVLLTAVDTARPGPVIATVSQNVFDTVTGRHLIVPQGSRLIGRHEGESAHGDRRAFLVWDRLILPNGASILLAEAPGVDDEGAVGVPGRTDRRLGALGIASLFAGAITTLGELARGGGDDRSFVAGAGDAASIEAAQVGGRLIDRELTVRPSIRVRAGAPVRVMITRDLILEPYRP